MSNNMQQCGGAKYFLFTVRNNSYDCISLLDSVLIAGILLPIQRATGFFYKQSTVKLSKEQNKYTDYPRSTILIFYMNQLKYFLFELNFNS